MHSLNGLLNFRNTIPVTCLSVSISLIAMCQHYQLLLFVLWFHVLPCFFHLNDKYMYVWSSHLVFSQVKLVITKWLHHFLKIRIASYVSCYRILVTLCDIPYHCTTWYESGLWPLGSRFDNFSFSPLHIFSEHHIPLMYIYCTFYLSTWYVLFMLVNQGTYKSLTSVPVLFNICLYDFLFLCTVCNYSNGAE